MKPLEVRLEDRLRSMRDKTFLYNAYPVKVLSYKFDGDYCTIATSGPWITRPQVQMLKLLDEFLETEDEHLPAIVDNRQEEAKPTVQMLGSFSDLAAIMLENIKKVQQDKAYAEQAQQVSLSVKVMIDMAKTEIEAIRAINDIRRNR